ncbi:MAG TPA: lysylphosphatidylglycerol synthase transmembrane domain-containing protein [Gemmatimonadales bacterium]|nr:lysylphosphatidylglycerol synthase transmembrane domain-containing protein [Gemmatimonadales bacterium]
MNHLLALGLVVLDCVVRAWRIQLAVWTAGGTLGFVDAVRLNLYGEAASTLTPNRLGGEPARFVGLTEARVRPVTSLVGIGVEVAAEWPVFMLMGAAMVAYYVPDWPTEARHWLHRHHAGELLAIEVVALLILGSIYFLQRMARSGAIRHRVRRQWRVAWAHVRRAPKWVLGAGAVLTAVSFAARALILPALAFGTPSPPFLQMFFGALTLVQAPLVVPLPSGGGGIEVVFLSGFAGDFGSRQVAMLLWWRVYTAVLLTVLGAVALIQRIGYRAATQLLKIGWLRRSKEKETV